MSPAFAQTHHRLPMRVVGEDSFEMSSSSSSEGGLGVVGSGCKIDLLYHRLARSMAR